MQKDGIENHQDDSKALKYGLLLGGGVAAAWGAYKLFNLKGVADKLSINIPKLQVSDKGLEYFKVIIDIEFINPSDTPIALKLQSAKPYYGDSELGYSVPLVETYTIEANNSTKIQNVEIRIPSVNILTSGLLKDVFTTSLSTLTQTLQQKINFKLFLVVNGIELSVEQNFGGQSKQLGLVAAGRRNIKDGSEYNYLFDLPKGRNEQVQGNGSVEDTVMWCGYVVKKFYKDTEKLAHFLQKKSKGKKELFKNIFDFCYKHIQYRLDRQGVEELRRPSVTWKDRKEGVDCDDFTMFIATILHNLNIPYRFRITKYNGRQNYQHIYLIVPIEGGKHVTIDPVLDTFDYEKPYSDKKDFTMDTLNLSGTQTGMGIPIEILSGVTNDRADKEDLYKVIYGYDLQGVISGLGSVEDESAALLRYLKRLRNVYAKNPKYIGEYQNPQQAIKMLDYAIKWWNTPKREAALKKLEELEDKLITNGEINLEGFDDDEDWQDDVTFSGTEPELSGFEYQYPSDDDWEEDIEFSGTEPELGGFVYHYDQPEWEEDFGFSGVETEESDYYYDYSVDGLNGRRRRKKKAKKAAKRARRKTKKTARRKKRAAKGGLFKRIGKVVKKGAKFAGRSLVRATATPMRLAFLTALKTNAGGISEKLKYAYLSEQQVIAKGIDRNEFLKLKKAHGNVERMFTKMGGKKEALRKAILSGKRKDLRGFEFSGGVFSGISGIDGWQQDLGYTGNEQEDTDFEYKYDSQIWSADEGFSGFEPESSNYEYDYSFDGLAGRRIRFKRRLKPFKRWFKRRKKKNHNNPRGQGSGVHADAPKQKQAIEIAGELLENAWRELRPLNTPETNKSILVKKSCLDIISQNRYHIATLLSYAYKTEAEIKAEGFPIEDWARTKTALEKARNAFINVAGGNEKELKNAILTGKDKANLEGLGSVAAAGAAVGIVQKVVSWIKDIKLKKQAKTDAKEAYTDSGGTNWRKEGNKQFNQQWANRLTEDSANSSGAGEQAQSSSLLPNFSSIVNKYAETTAVSPEQAQSIINNSSNQITQTPLETPVGFWPKHKKKIIIGTGVLAAGGIGYAIYSNIQKEKEEKAQRDKSLKGVQTKARKAPVKSKAKKLDAKKLSVVKLR